MPEVVAMSDDIKLYWMFLLVGSIPVAVAIWRSAAWGVQATAGAAMIVWGLYGIVRCTASRRRHPVSGASR